MEEHGGEQTPVAGRFVARSALASRAAHFRHAEHRRGLGKMVEHTYLVSNEENVRFLKL